MIGRLLCVLDPRSHPRPTTGTDDRVAALAVAALLTIGALMGSVNLVVPGVLREGSARWAYGGTMLLLLGLAAHLARRRRIGQGHVLVLVLLGDVTYLVVVLCIHDPLRYATPLMLLFPALAAAWFLRLRQLGVHMALTVVVCLAALWPSYESTAGVLLQAGISAGMLNAAAGGMFLLRRRVERLLVTTAELTRRDPLTGLSNRRHLDEQAARVWGHARREGTAVFAVLLDLDHFKRINDEFGHAAGDAVLGVVACTLTATVRPDDLLARIGGEELVVVGSVDGTAEARHLAERLRSAVADARSDDGHAVTASVGLALTRPVDDEEPAPALWRLIGQADTAMYAAKRGGRDQVAGSGVPPPRAPLVPRAELPEHPATA